MSSLKFSRRDVMAGGLLALLAGGTAAAQSNVIAAKFRLEGGRVLIDAVLNGKGPYPFVVDTGAIISGIRVQLAKDLNLKYVRDVRLGQPGRNYPMYSVDDLALGGAVRQANVALFGLEDAILGGEGLLASGMAVALDSELDFDALQWRLYPGGRTSWDGYTKLDSEVDVGQAAGSPHIFVQATYDGKPLKLLVDTGSPRPLSLDQAAAKRLGLDDKPWAPARVTRVGVIDTQVSRVVRGGALTIGGQAFETGLVTLRPPGSHGSVKHDGILGLPIIQRMNLAIQARDRVAWIKPSSRPFQPQYYGASGVWLEEAPDGATIVELAPGSPAALAGLRVGDRIVGEPDFKALIRRINGPFGSEVDLKVQRGKAVEAAKLSIRDYL